MRRSIIASLGLLTILSIFLHMELMSQASAGNRRCHGADCNDKDPVDYQCDADASVVDQVKISVRRLQDNFVPKQIIIQKLYSKACNANWTRAYIPEKTYLFIREQSPVNSNETIHGKARPKGNGYFWANSTMSDGRVVNQACASLTGPAWFWYDRYCTDFSLGSKPGAR